MPGRMEFEYRFGRSPSARARDRSGPRRILVLGDLSGRRNRGIVESETLPQRRLPSVDVDTLETVFSRISPRLDLAIGRPQQPVPLAFESLEDFHPDALYRKLDGFRSLRHMRDRLRNPSTFADAVAELRALDAVPPAAEPAAGASGAVGAADATGTAASEPAEDDASTLDRLLGDRPTGAVTDRSRADSLLSGFLRNLVAPDVVAAKDPRQDEFVRLFDRGIGERMREVIHHPDFQALEAVWIGIRELVNGLEIGEEVTLQLLDVSRDELQKDLFSCDGDLEKAGIYRLLVGNETGTLGSEPWSLLVADFTFENTADDLRLLAGLGALAASAGAPILAAAARSVLGCDSLTSLADPNRWSPLAAEAEERWSALRTGPQASWIGLSMPRFLLRQPYGAKSDAIESFDFDEIPDPETDHESCLWGNPAFGCARLIALSAQDDGAGRTGDQLDLEDLPAFTYRDADGDSRMMPCAELNLTERAAETILGRGIMPLMSYRQRNAVRVLRLQSLADPPARLAGPWD